MTGTIHCAECFEQAYSAYGHKRTCSLYGISGYASHYRSSRTFERHVIQTKQAEMLLGLFHVALFRVEQLEAEAFKLSAGVCEFRSGNEHGNAMCLATGQLIERMKTRQHSVDCMSRVGRACNCDFHQ